MATKKFKLINLLNSATDAVACTREPSCTVRTRISDPLAKSKYCQGTSMSADVSISCIALVMDRILLRPETIAALKLNDSVYLEIEDKAYLATKAGIRTLSETSYTAGDILTCLLFYYTEFSGKDELAEICRGILEEYKKARKVSVRSIAKLCDSFYYGIVAESKMAATVDVADDLILQEVEAAVRAGFDRTLFEDAGLAKVKKIAGETRRKKERKKSTTVEEVLDLCRQGYYKVPYAWDEEQSWYIQDMSLLDRYVPNEVFVALLEKVRYRLGNVLERWNPEQDTPANRVKAIGMDHVNVTLSGVPGTGKTLLCYALSAATGMPVYTVSLSHNTDEDEAQGLTKMVDGKPTAVPTDIVRAFEKGGILVLEEANLPQAAVLMGALGQAVEFPFILKKDGYQPIRRHPLCVIVTTMNVGTAGSKPMSQAFANRFKQSYRLPEPTREDFIHILESSGADTTMCRWTYDCYTRIVNCVKNEPAANVGSILLALSMRTCFGAIENMVEGVEPRAAVEYSIIGKIAEQDQEVADNCCQVLKSMRDPDFV